MNSPVEQIKERLGIEEVISSYVKIEHSGTNLKAKCPFHNEKTPSFFLSPARGTYYCFGCGAKGDIFSFVQEFEGLDFKGALKILAERAGVSLGKFDKETEGEKEKLRGIMEKATRFFEHNLTEQTSVLAYLFDRGLTEETIKKFRIGFAPSSWDALCKHLRSEGVSDTLIERAGLGKGGERGLYDRFRSRIMFPIGDSSGRIIAFSGRIFGDNDKEEAKYLNSPETPLFKKSAVLYGMDKAKESIRKNNFSILVEGQMDLVLSHQAGFRNTVATSGTALSGDMVGEEAVSNLGLARRLSQNIVLAFDSDRAGLKAIEKAAKIALSMGMDVKAADIPEGQDPADMVREGGAEAWKMAVRNSKHVIDFFLDKILSQEKDQRKIGRRVKEEILPYVVMVESSIEKTHFLKKISEQSGIPGYALEEDLRKVKEESRGELRQIQEIEHNSEKMLRRDFIERRILGIFFWQESTEGRVIDVEETKKILASVMGNKFEQFVARGQDDREELVFEAEVFYRDEANLKKDLEELISNLEEEYLKEELFKKMRELKMAEEEKNFNRSEELLREYQELNEKLEIIKAGRLKK